MLTAVSWKYLRNKQNIQSCWQSSQPLLLFSIPPNKCKFWERRHKREEGEYYYYCKVILSPNRIFKHRCHPFQKLYQSIIWSQFHTVPSYLQTQHAIWVFKWISNSEFESTKTVYFHVIIPIYAYHLPKPACMLHISRLKNNNVPHNPLSRRSPSQNTFNVQAGIIRTFTSPVPICLQTRLDRPPPNSSVTSIRLTSITVETDFLAGTFFCWRSQGPSIKSLFQT